MLGFYLYVHNIKDSLIIANFVMFIADNSQDDYTIWSLFLVYVGAALPDFAYRDTNFLPSLEGNATTSQLL